MGRLYRKGNTGECKRLECKKMLDDATVSDLFLVLGDGPGVGRGVPAWLISSMLASGAVLDILGVIIMLAGHIRSF